MAVTRGKDFKLYRNTDDPYDDSPTWAEVENVRDLTRTLEKALADASIRGSSYRMQVGTLKDLSVEFQMVYDPTDPDWDAFEAAFDDDSDIEALILDGPISVAGSKGIRFMSQVSSFTTNEALEDVGLTDVTLVPGYAPTNLPRRVEVVTPGSVQDVA
jgi:hypothetical protein